MEALRTDLNKRYINDDYYNYYYYYIKKLIFNNNIETYLQQTNVVLNGSTSIR